MKTMNEGNPIAEKSLAFAERIVRMYQYLNKEKRERILSAQLLRSGTSIGANVREAKHGQSRKDFLSKMQIALKEAEETLYWVTLLYRTDYLSKSEYESISRDGTELVKILVRIVKSTKENV